jgi:D-tyrosyl-tRNA(Tyr) deacylase
MTIRHMTCCCCGDDAGRWEQHWNRDTGYGICAKCVAEEMGREPPERIKELYGTAGVHYREPMIVEGGRRFKAMAVFPLGERGQRDANAFMERTPGAAVLCVSDGIYLAHVDDKGEPITRDGLEPA